MKRSLVSVFSDFYPRPPRGGRPPVTRLQRLCDKISIHALREEGDIFGPGDKQDTGISIHALREEGDTDLTAYALHEVEFLSTPSARRATRCRSQRGRAGGISIHALREEGDAVSAVYGPDAGEISIHALREEGDRAVGCRRHRRGDFYPRPPRGGRRREHKSVPFNSNFYPRPPRGGRRLYLGGKWFADVDFYPRPPRGGRHQKNKRFPVVVHFYPRPPRGGRQQKQRQNLYFQTNYTTFCTNLEEL